MFSRALRRKSCFVLCVNPEFSGTASFEVEFDHYSPIAGKVAESVIAAAKAAKEAEKE